MRRVFLDSSFAIALAAPSDNLHRKAQDLADQLELEGTLLLTTRAILLEIGNALSKPRQRPMALRLLADLEEDSRIEIVALTDEVYVRGLELFRRRPDKSWGLVDCISFEVMKKQGLTESLTADEHFEQAGFRALLRTH